MITKYNSLYYDERSACFTEDLEVKHITVNKYYLEKIVRSCNQIMVFDIKIRLLRTEINRRQSRRDVRKKRQFRGRVWFDYQGFGRARYHSVRDETCREIEIANHVSDSISILDPYRRFRTLKP